MFSLPKVSLRRVSIISGGLIKPLSYIIPGTYLTKDQHARSNLLVYSPIQCSTIVIMLYGTFNMPTSYQ